MLKGLGQQIRMHPYSKKIVSAAYRHGYGQLHHLPYQQARKKLNQYKRHRYQSPASTTDVVMDNQCRIRLYQPVQDIRSSVILCHFHGGGFVSGSIEHADYFCHRVSHESGCTVASISYRLAPEYKFPIAYEDALYGMDWVINHLGGSPKKTIVVSGESSGGNLAASVCQERISAIKGQVLLYPSLDYHNTYASKTDLLAGFLLDKPLRQWLVSHYLHDDQQRSDRRVSPMLRPTLLTPQQSLIISAEYDPMRDEAIAFAKRLGASCRWLCCKGMIHGFMQHPLHFEAVDQVFELIVDMIEQLN